MVRYGHRWHTVETGVFRAEGHNENRGRRRGRDPEEYSTISNEELGLRQDRPPGHAFAGDFFTYVFFLIYFLCEFLLSIFMPLVHCRWTMFRYEVEEELCTS